MGKSGRQMGMRAYLKFIHIYFEKGVLYLRSGEQARYAFICAQAGKPATRFALRRENVLKDRKFQKH